MSRYMDAVREDLTEQVEAGQISDQDARDEWRAVAEDEADRRKEDWA